MIEPELAPTDSAFTLAGGRLMLAIPGPSMAPDRVMAAMARPMINIYEGELVDRSYAMLDDLSAVARTGADTLVSVGNGHGAWEMVITNTMSAGDKVLVLESGIFAVDWGNSAAAHGVDVEVLPAASPRVPVDPEAVADRLSADKHHEIRAVLVVHTDTASSVRNDIQAIRAAMDSASHPALLMVDAIASLGCERYKMDEWGVDVTVGASQKGLMCPPGLGFAWASEKALAAHERAGLRNAHSEWSHKLSRERHYRIYGGTPPVGHIMAMSEALDMIKAEGLENVWRRHRVHADAVRAAVEAWSAPGGLELNILEPEFRSDAVTTIRANEIDQEQLRAWCQEGAGLILGLGIGPNFEGVTFRIGHMGHLNPPMILGTLATVEAALISMEAPMGSSGMAAAAAVVAGSL